MEVRAHNAGTSPSRSTWLDVFFGAPAAADLGDYGDAYRRIPELAAGASRVYRFERPSAGWVYAIIDTDETVVESDESNNVTPQYVR